MGCFIKQTVLGLQVIKLYPYHPLPQTNVARGNFKGNINFTLVICLLLTSFIWDAEI